MKIVSWNLNGMRAAFRHGLSEFLTSCDADIFCFQETKLSEPTALANKAGFRAYWTFNEQRRGYSGTLVLTRHLPLHMQSTLPDPNLDSEARVQTLEFANFYLVNAYFPRSLGSEGRRDYRRKFDEAVLEHLQTLANTKAVLLSGDLNAPMPADEFSAENTWQEKNAQGFLPEEREGLHAIVAAGFVDAYRQIHPTERERYSWWSPRLYKRRENRGWRLDHFFVHESIAHKIEECTMLTHVYGSDHCPVVLEIDVDPGTVAVNSDAVEVQRETYRRTSLLASDESILFQLSAGDLGAMWQKINWSQTEERLLELQRALSHAAYSKNKARIRACQRKITSNFEARLLAVRHVCTMAGGPGVDGVQWKTPEAKMLAALTLNQGDYHALPSRLLIIQCRKEKSRHIHVETFYDRAMQALYSYALDPVAEAWADKRSFSYRKGRGSYDMNEHIIRIFSGPGAPAWVLIGDISKCYQNISHQWVLENIPLPRKILREFLEAGFVFSGELFPTGSGVGIGCALSPIIANMTLDGMQAHLDSVAPSATLVRYADDVLVAAASRTQAQTAQAALGTFLALRGLELSANKTQIVPVVSGFEFCARSYLLRGEQMYAKPSQDSIERFMGSLRETILGWSGSQQNLIKKLNRKIDGWVTYHKTTDALDAFRAIDVYISALLLQLCQAKHPKWRRS